MNQIYYDGGTINSNSVSFKNYSPIFRLINKDVISYSQENVLQIKEALFFSRSNSFLQSVNFPDCITIGISAFQGCTSLQSISFPVCTTIGGSAFQGCTSLQSISFPVCTTIGGSAFFGCISLQSASFPVCTSIGSCAFQNCISLQSVNFPVCTFIRYQTFLGCTSLQSASFPVCTDIDGNAFLNCSKLSAIYLLASTVCYLNNSNAFLNTPISNSSYLGYFGSIYVPSSLVATYKTAKNWTYYADRITSYVE